MSSAQQKFNTLYMSSHEVCSKLSCQRITVFRHIAKGALPPPIRIGEGKTLPVLFERAAAEAAIQKILG